VTGEATYDEDGRATTLTARVVIATGSAAPAAYIDRWDVTQSSPESLRRTPRGRAVVRGRAPDGSRNRLNACWVASWLHRIRDLLGGKSGRFGLDRSVGAVGEPFDQRRTDRCRDEPHHG
jgi:hypothetical protein